MRDWRLAACLTLALAACAPAAKPRVQPAPPVRGAPAAPSTADTTLATAPLPLGLVPWPRHLAAGTGGALTVGPTSKIFVTAITPGPYFHIGGDEVKTLTAVQYRAFVERVQTIVQSHGKQMIGWDEVAAVTLLPTSIVQHWRPDAAHAEPARAPHLILSPGNRTYLDMKYDEETALGLKWAGLIPVKTAYDWDPAALVPEAPAASVLGVEAPLWSETIANLRDAEFLAMPRLAAIAEVGWSPAGARDWDGFRVRLGAQGPRWAALGINFYRAAEIPWK